jgi:crotonobetainyl-CoA:carnitine CoA-transferase CaiB-like acyl-CoA transferase
MVADHPGLVWVSITGYGREGDAAQRVAFGDDAAAAGGLVGRDGGGDPVFCGDAIADPLTGAMAALVSALSLADGGGRLLDVPMAGVAAWAAGASAGGPTWPEGHPVEPDGDRWVVRCGSQQTMVEAPVPFR